MGNAGTTAVRSAKPSDRQADHQHASAHHPAPTTESGPPTSKRRRRGHRHRDNLPRDELPPQSLANHHGDRQSDGGHRKRLESGGATASRQRPPHRRCKHGDNHKAIDEAHPDSRRRQVIVVRSGTTLSVKPGDCRPQRPPFDRRQRCRRIRRLMAAAESCTAAGRAGELSDSGFATPRSSRYTRCPMQETDCSSRYS